MADFLKQKASSKVAKILLFLLLSVGFLAVSIAYFTEVSSFAVIATVSVLAISIFMLFDKYIMHEIDTITELKKGNVAYALFLLGICIVIAAAIISAF